MRRRGRRARAAFSSEFSSAKRVRKLTLQAIDAAGNVGPAATVKAG